MLYGFMGAQRHIDVRNVEMDLRKHILRCYGVRVIRTFHPTHALLQHEQASQVGEVVGAWGHVVLFTWLRWLRKWVG